MDMKDSGERETFDSGAVREPSTGKGSYALISPIALARLAIVLERGRDKYSSRNWEKGMPMERLMESAMRHIAQFLEGQRDEDHLGQAMFNIMAGIHMMEMMNRGLISPEFNDLPDYNPHGNLAASAERDMQIYGWEKNE